MVTYRRCITERCFKIRHILVRPLVHEGFGRDEDRQVKLECFRYAAHWCYNTSMLRYKVYNTEDWLKAVDDCRFDQMLLMS